MKNFILFRTIMMLFSGVYGTFFFFCFGFFYLLIFPVVSMFFYFLLFVNIKRNPSRLDENIRKQFVFIWGVLGVLSILLGVWIIMTTPTIINKFLGLFFCFFVIDSVLSLCLLSPFSKNVGYVNNSAVVFNDNASINTQYCVSDTSDCITHYDYYEHPAHASESSSSLVINPANGAPMFGGESGIDVYGNTYGSNDI